MTDQVTGTHNPTPADQPLALRLNVHVRLPEWLVQWMTVQWMEDPYRTATVLIESAMVKAYKLRPTRAPANVRANRPTRAAKE
jgi:hypothetical protein